MSELRRRGAVDVPAERPDARPAADAPTSDPVDHRRAISAQKDFVREPADAGPDATDRPADTLDWATGKPTETRPAEATDDALAEVGNVDDPMSETRPYDRPGGLSHPDRRDQWSLEHVVPRDDDGRPSKYPSLDGEWPDYINDGGPEADPLRGNNCLDCSMAALATWYGHPTVAAPRTADVDPVDGRVDLRAGEHDGITRAERWTEGRYEGFGGGDSGYAAIERKLREAGPGSSAAIINAWNTVQPSSHAWNAFNDGGKIVWYGPQEARKSERPLYQGPQVKAVWAVCLDKEGNQL